MKFVVISDVIITYKMKFLLIIPSVKEGQRM